MTTEQKPCRLCDSWLRTVPYYLDVVQNSAKFLSIRDPLPKDASSAFSIYYEGFEDDEHPFLYNDENCDGEITLPVDNYENGYLDRTGEEFSLYNMLFNKRNNASPRIRSVH